MPNKLSKLFNKLRPAQSVATDEELRLREQVRARIESWSDAKKIDAGANEFLRRDNDIKRSFAIGGGGWGGGSGTITYWN